jgi:predicted nuclease of predicted toxin-antitoxin system
MKIYIDENMPPQLSEGIAILEKPNNEGVEVYSIQKEYGRGIQDEDWIPQVGQVNGIVITQDAKMQRIKTQYELLKKYKLGIFYLIPPGKKGFTYWEMVEKVIFHWKEIKDLSRKTSLLLHFVLQQEKLKKLASKVLHRTGKLFQKPHIIFAEQAQVFYLVFKHGNSFYTHTKCKAGVFVTVYTAVIKHIGVHHTTSQNFYPASFFTNAATFATAN